MKKVLFLLIAGLMVSAIIIGCGTEEPWESEPTRPLELVIVSAPDTATDVPHNSSVSFSWGSKGGSGNVAGYQWYLSPLETGYGSILNLSSVTYEALAGGDNGIDYTFYVRVTDSDNDTASASISFAVSDTLAPPAPDSLPPSVVITESPIEGSFVAAGTYIHFSWEGDDGQGNLDQIEYQYAFPTLADSTGWVYGTSATFSNVAAADPALFFVRARDQALNVSDWDSVSFIIKNASILYVDDFQWVDFAGNVDMSKERNQKQFYRNVLDGYAFAEWDIAVQGMPDSADLVVGGTPVYSTIVWCSDSEVGTVDGTWWFDIGTVNGASLRYYLENGGNLIVSGAWVLYYVNNTNPPAAGDFEYDWLAIDSTGGDEGVAWDYWWWFTWAVKDTSTTLDFPDSMKIDISKNGDQDDYASEVIHYRDDADVSVDIILRWGLWVDGTAPIYDPDYEHPYDWPVGHIANFTTGQKVALLGFDTYAMPLADTRQTIGAILGDFGE